MLQHIEMESAFDLKAVYHLAQQCALRFSKQDAGTPIGWQEIAYMRCEQPARWRFMGVSLNVLSDSGYYDEIVSSIFRNNPVEEIHCPWDAVFSFCETTLQLSMGRIFPPVVRFIDSMHEDWFYQLRDFDYATMQWHESIHPLAVLSSAS